MLKTLKVTIEDKDYEIKDLTIGQLEDIQELLGVFATATAVSLTKDNQRSLIAVALSVDYPEVTADVVRKMRFGTIQKMSGIVREILRFGGFVVHEKLTAESGDAAPAEA